MATRELTEDERQKLNRAWEEYLDVSYVAETTLEVHDAWEQYQNTLRDLNVIVTLAGYRVEL